MVMAGGVGSCWVLLGPGLWPVVPATRSPLGDRPPPSRCVSGRCVCGRLCVRGVGSSRVRNVPCSHLKGAHTYGSTHRSDGIPHRLRWTAHTNPGVHHVQWLRQLWPVSSIFGRQGGGGGGFVAEPCAKWSIAELPNALASPRQPTQSTSGAQHLPRCTVGRFPRGFYFGVWRRRLVPCCYD